MAKYDFQSSRYAKFFQSKSNINYLQNFVDNSDIFFCNYTWYLTQGRKDALPTLTQPDGTATFQMTARKLTAAPIMSLRAPLGDAPQAAHEGFAFYTATIPDFITEGWTETAMERHARQLIYETFGNDSEIVNAWADTVQQKIDSVDATLTYMTAQLISTGKIDYTGMGQGIQAPLYKADIPSDNFKTAGSLVWTDSSCQLLDQMKKIEDDYRDKFAYSGQLVWQVPRDMFFDTILENAQVKELITSYKSNPLAWQAHTEGQTPTEVEFRNAIKDFQGISTIEIVTEKVRNKTGITDEFVHGWDQNAAVLRPAGDAVVFKYTNNLDQLLDKAYGAKAITKVFASTNNGLGTLVNTTLDNGRFQEWHTDMMMSAVPALLNFPYHYIIDTTTADA